MTDYHQSSLYSGHSRVPDYRLYLLHSHLSDSVPQVNPHVASRYTESLPYL